MTTTLAQTVRGPTLPILVALSLAHLLNDLIQSMIPAIYPLLKESYQLSFSQIGGITLAFQVTSSLLQPMIGYVADRRPWPYAMVAGMAATLTGLVGLAIASSYPMILLAAALVGLGSAVFHPEATRMARHAAASQQGLGQGIFQIGGHVGYAVGPLLAAALVVPRGQGSLVWISIVALAAMLLMGWTGARYSEMRRFQALAGLQGRQANASFGQLAFAFLQCSKRLLRFLLQGATFFDLCTQRRGPFAYFGNGAFQHCPQIDRFAQAPRLECG